MLPHRQAQRLRQARDLRAAVLNLGAGKKRPAALLLIPAALCGGLSACAPSATQTSAVRASVSVQCAGQTSGTLTKAKATLSLNVLPDGRAEGSFVNNGTLFKAVGVVPGRLTAAGTYTIDSLSLQLDSRLTGGLNAVAGTQPVGLAVAYGSTGLLAGTVGLNGQFRGLFRGVQGNYGVEMTCTS